MASKKKKEAVISYLEDLGLDKKAIHDIKSPAGIDINAKKPEEVAISILAEIIQVRNNLPDSFAFTQFDDTRTKQVNQNFISTRFVVFRLISIIPKHIIEYKNEKVYFCCDGCKVKFEQDPEKYMNKDSTAT